MGYSRWSRVKRVLQALKQFDREREEEARAKERLEKAFLESIISLRDSERVGAILEDQLQKIQGLQGVLGVEYHEVPPFDTKRKRRIVSPDDQSDCYDFRGYEL